MTTIKEVVVILATLVGTYNGLLIGFKTYHEWQMAKRKNLKEKELEAKRKRLSGRKARKNR
ncbi:MULTISPECIES: hypothetical protein [Bacillus cereus group]|uniref:hypothetical protein n=1 Tax=Bacillus cereus group TaxID=86661 RepID=UPI000BEF9D71|nr:MULTISPECIES: hypothetical protein [Bacillus cereus group]PEL24294.1 hypothetical protein CN624_18015 [Bacillus toyonensis]HEF5065762.1 hypothetical protein [Bacillus cereus]HEF5237746.1 hypothetical protein [Bacillus cereus]